MNKAEIQKRIAEVDKTIDGIISKAIMLTRDQVHELDIAYAEMERLQFQLGSLEDDGSK